jgi:hypothetical protein
MSSRVLAALVGLSVGSPAFAQTFTVAGACPGQLDLTVDGATANGQVVFITGTLGGSTVLGGGPCVGTTVDLGAPLKVRFKGPADANGSKTLSPVVAAGACQSGGQWMDVTTCGVTEALSLTPVCEQPDVSWVDGGLPGAQMADPALIALWTENSVDDGLYENFNLEDPAAVQTPIPATLVVDLLDAGQNLMCSIFYDIDTAVADPTYSAVSLDLMGAATANVVPVFDGVSVTVGAGATDCGPINPNGALAMAYGIGDDVRALFDGGWVMGYHQPSADFEALIVAVLGQAAWTNDWEPFINTQSFLGLELDFVNSFDRTCDIVDIDAGGLLQNQLNAQPGPLTEHHLSAAAWLLGL